MEHFSLLVQGRTVAGLPHVIPMLRRTSSSRETANSFSRTSDVMLVPSWRGNSREDVDVSKRVKNRCSWRLGSQDDPFLFPFFVASCLSYCRAYLPVCFRFRKHCSRLLLSCCLSPLLENQERGRVGCLFQVAGTFLFVVHVFSYHVTACFFVFFFALSLRVVAKHVAKQRVRTRGGRKTKCSRRRRCDVDLTQGNQRKLPSNRPIKTSLSNGK